MRALAALALSPPKCVAPHTSVSRALAELQRVEPTADDPSGNDRIGLVMEAGRPVGVICQRRLLLALQADGAPQTVGDLMDTGFVAVPDNAGLIAGLARLYARRANYILVVGVGGLPLGLFSAGVLVRAICVELGESGINADPLEATEPLRQSAHVQAQEEEIRVTLQKLQRSEERLSFAMQGARDGLWDWDLNSGEVYFSARWKEMLGFSEDEIGDDLDEWERRIHPRDRVRVREALQAHLRGNTAFFDSAHRIRHKDGHYLWVLNRARLVRDSHDEPCRIVGTQADLTRQRYLEEEVQRWASVFHTTTEGIVITDERMRIVDVNRAFTTITGYSRDEALGKKPYLLRPGPGGGPYRRDMWASIRESGNWQGEVWGRRKDGSRYPEWLAINRVVEVGGAITGYIGVFADISAVKDAQERLDYLAHHDPLTGLYNRVMLIARLEHAVERARRSGERVALLFLDLDHFKVINDTLGHPAGDALLQQIATRLTDALREEDTVARLAGDEFILLLEGISNPADLALVAQKIIDTLRAPIAVSGHLFHTSTSVGIAVYPMDGHDAHSLIKNADAAMYLAKERGRNTFKFYTRELEQKAFGRLAIEELLPDAVRNNQLVLHYQPQVSMADGRVIGAEALVRWQHPKEGLLSPQHFIPVAEHSGQIIELEHWVLRNACAQAQRWKRRGFPIKRLAVNLSGNQFNHGNLVQMVQEILAQTGMPPDELELEITETTLMQHMRETARVLAELKEMGIHLAIDDFGTGYSSLNYLKRLPIDKLKIDRCFVRDIPGDASDKAIAQAVIALGHGLGLTVLAEGVETAEQEAYLMGEGCLQAQGFRYGKPMPPKAFQSLLAKGGDLTPTDC